MISAQVKSSKNFKNKVALVRNHALSNQVKLGLWKVAVTYIALTITLVILAKLAKISWANSTSTSPPLEDMLAHVTDTPQELAQRFGDARMLGRARF